MRPLRFYLTLSGGASLGAYEAGAAAGLVLVARYLDAQAVTPGRSDGLDAEAHLLEIGALQSTLGLVAPRQLMKVQACK